MATLCFQTMGLGSAHPKNTSRSRFSLRALSVALIASMIPFSYSIAATDNVEMAGGNSRAGNMDSTGASVAIGHNSKVFMGTGNQEALLTWGQTVCNRSFFGICLSYGPSEEGKTNLPEGIVIGTNAFARTGSVSIGARTLPNGKTIGDLTDPLTMPIMGIADTTVGANSFVNAAFATTLGSYNVQSSPYTANGGTDLINNGSRNAFATMIGTFNSNESYDAAFSSTSGVGNFIGGVANKVSNSNGTLVIGGGNKISNSNASLVSFSDFVLGLPDTPKALQERFIEGLQENAGGSVLVLGSGNTVDYALFSQALGVQNSITGTQDEVSRYNAISGTKNVLTNASHTYVAGNNNQVTTTNGAILLGDNRVLSSADRSIVLGFSTGTLSESSDTRTATNVADAVVLGTDSQVQAAGGVAIGSNTRVAPVAQTGDLAGIALGDKSVATILAGVAGYDPATSAASTNTGYVWTSTAAALSLGDVTSETKVTRQITGVAAGTADTDAVNVAQLKAAISHLTPSSSDPNASQNAPATTISANGGSETNVNGTEPKNLTVVESTNSHQGKHYDIRLANKIQLGSNTANNQVTIDGDLSQVTIGSGANAIHFDGNTGEVGLGKVQVNGSTGTVGGLTNTTWDGTNYTSGQAATEDQLYQATRAQDDRYRQLARDIRELDSDIRDAGAASAAVAGLKPIQYDPLQPTQFMAAVGGYRGSYALSLGLAHYTSERFMLHAGVAVNQHPMFNVGFTFKFGGKSFKMNDQEYRAAADRYKAGPITASYVMQKELADDQEAKTQGLLTKVQSLETQNAELVSKNAALENKVTELAKAMDELKALIKASRR